MININGTIHEKESFPLLLNRGFLYADALFDTLLVINNKLIFVEEHYFRLLAGIRQLRMEIPSYFTQSYWQTQIEQTLQANHLSQARVRTTVYRDSDGFYTPGTHKSSILIQVNPVSLQTKKEFSLGLYKDNFINTNSIDAIKTTNRIVNILAAIYTKEQGLDDSLLLNHRKELAETSRANIFLITGNKVKTPNLESGCIQGITRKKVIEIINESSELTIEETTITPFELQQADEVFTTNSISLVQPVTHYKRQRYNTKTGNLIQAELMRVIREEN